MALTSGRPSRAVGAYQRLPCYYLLSLVAVLGMQVWHHKTMHKKFKYGLPLILLAQIALIYIIIQK